MQLKYPKKTKAKKTKTKRWSKQRVRKHYINACCDLWAILVKHRDNYTCQFTQRTDKAVHSHHIVFKGTLKGKLAGYFDLDNGVTLSSYEHKEAHHGEPDAYIEKRDKFLKLRGLDYKKMRTMYMMQTKVTQSHLAQIYIAYTMKVEGLRVYSEQLEKIHKRWMLPMAKAGVV